MRLIKKSAAGQRRVYDIEVAEHHNFYANGINVHNCTGLQVPTIAVATAGGVSVIKHNGTVVNSNSVQSFVSLKFDQYKMFGSLSGNGLLYRTGVPTKDLQSSFAFTNFSITNAPDISRAAGYKVINSNRNLLRAHIAPLVQGMRVNENTEAASATFAITNTFNTGHLIGDIKRCFLADVDVGSVSGTELVTNGTFDTADGWTENYDGTNGWRITGGVAEHVGTLNVYLNSVHPITNLKWYRLTCTVTGSVSIETNNVGVLLLGAGASSYVFQATSTGNLRFYSNAAGTIDNISIKEVVADYSYKAQAASITGTLTKTQVAAAAQLVAYSGFSAANYLRENWSADLDFGTGEWSASAWVNVPVIPTTPANVTTNVAGGNLAPGGGTFDSATGYTLGEGWSISGGVASRVAGSSFANLTVSAGLTPGKSYVLELDVNAMSTVGLTVAGITYINGDVNALSQFTSTGRKKVVFTAGSAVLFLQANSGPATCTVDNLSITEVLPFPIAERSHSSGAKLQLGIMADGKLTATAFDGTTTRTVTTTAAYNTATWIKPEAVYTTDGTLAIRVNGVEVAATRGTPLLTLNNSSAVLTIGNSFATDAPFPGSIALLKLSATVPTAEQSQWMYEQEKQMFRAGAQVTLPDAGSIVDLTYDDATDKWIAVSATNESEWSGLVRTSVTASPAGSYTKVAAASGVQLQARRTTSPGVDITIPSYGLRDELVRRAESAARLARNMVTFDYVGGFTANTTTGSTAIASVASLTYPVSYVGARISGAGIPANTTVVAVSGTTIYMSAAATATASGVQISFVDFNLPLGYEAKEVSTAGAAKTEGSTKDFTRLFDGFKETIRFGTAPGLNVAVQIQAKRSVQ